MKKVIGVFHDKAEATAEAWNKHKEAVSHIEGIVINDRSRQISLGDYTFLYGNIYNVSDAYAYSGIDFQAIFLNSDDEAVRHFMLNRLRPK